MKRALPRKWLAFIVFLLSSHLHNSISGETCRLLGSLSPDMGVKKMNNRGCAARSRGSRKQISGEYGVLVNLSLLREAFHGTFTLSLRRGAARLKTCVNVSSSEE